MNLIQRYQPNLSWIDELDRLFDRSLRNLGGLASQREQAYETPDSWVLRLDLPGFSKGDIQLKVDDRTLRLHAETPAERTFGGTVERQWKLGPEVNTGAISARMENGVLELTLPRKSKEEVQPVTIEVK
jgi:HSP20 family protein